MNPAPVVLLAEDNEDDRFLSSRTIAKAGVETVRHVPDGRQAIDYLAGHGVYADRALHPLPDILLLDLKMPRHTGHEVLEWLRRNSSDFDKELRTYLFSEGDILTVEERAESK